MRKTKPPKMSLKKCGAALLLALLLFLAACGPSALAMGGGADATSNALSGNGTSANGSSVPAAPADGQLHVFLPSGSDELEELLQATAQAEGFSLRVKSPPRSAQYAQALAQALESADVPDLFLAEDLNDTGGLSALHFRNLLGQGSGRMMRALAGLAPKASAATRGSALVGLPVGYYAEGYLCDISLLGMLLGAKDLHALQRNIVACSWEEWYTLVTALEQYLLKPGGISIRLNGERYTTPGFRPQGAQQLRGAFALADGNAQSLAQNTLGAVVGTAYGSLSEMNADNEEDKIQVLMPAFRALYGLMDVESMYMSRPTGAPYRGEEYEADTALSREQALAQLTAGTALFCRADSRAGAQLCDEKPELADRLFLVPLKLPPPEDESEENTAEATVDSAEAQGNAESGEDAGDAGAAVGSGEDAGNTSEDAEVNADTDAAEEAEIARRLNQAVAGIVNENNSRPWYASAGYWCINAKTQRGAQAEALLLRLYTSEASRQALWEKLRLQAFTQLYPSGLLRAQVQAVAMAGAGNLLPGSDKATEMPAALISSYIQEELLPLAEWGEAEEAAFINRCLSAFGLPEAAEGR